VLFISFFLVVVIESYRDGVCCKGFRWGFEVGGWG
jgi:hypothetical protein